MRPAGRRADRADYLALKARGLSHTRASLTIARKLARRYSTPCASSVRTPHAHQSQMTSTLPAGSSNCRDLSVEVVEAACVRADEDVRVRSEDLLAVLAAP